jgi:raffinose/stachyose/melibiose transport system permease protein
MSDTLGTDTAVGRQWQGTARVGGAGVPAPPASPRAGARRRGRARMRLEIAVLSGPPIIVFLAFVIFPVALAAYYGFYRWHGYGPATDWVGLNNDRLILTDPAFHQVLWHNLSDTAARPRR